MRKTPRSLADAREELVQVQEEFTRLQKRIEGVRDCVADSLVRFFGEQHPQSTGWRKRNSSKRLLAVSLPRLAPHHQSLRQKRSRNTCEHAATRLLGVSPSALRSWRGKRRALGPPSHASRQDGACIPEEVGAIRGAENR